MATPLFAVLVEPEDRVEAPRTLKAPAFWKFSHLKNSSAPVIALMKVEVNRRAVDMRPDALVRDLHVIEAGNVHGTVFGAC